MIKRCLTLLALFALLVPGAAMAAPEHGGTLVMGSIHTPRHFNAGVQSGTATALPSAQIFASPLLFDADRNPQPYLAEKWEFSEDSLSLTLHLVKNAVFHDGEPITSADVAFSVMTVKENHPFKTMLEPVIGVDTPDPHTAVIRLSQPHPALLLAMSPVLMPIMPKHIYDNGEDMKTHPANLKPVGSGPFKLTEYKAGEYYVLEKHDKFFIPGKPYLDKIIVRIIPDPNSLALGLEAGELHFVPYMSEVRMIDRLEKTKGVIVSYKGYDGTGPLQWLAFNCGKKPLDDVRVRQAICYVMDRDFIVNRIFAGKATPVYGPLPDSSPFAAHDLEPYALDIDKANALLDEAGYKKGPGGVRFSLTIDTQAGNEKMRILSEYLRPQLKKIGIDATLRVAADFPTWAKRVSEFDFDMTIDVVSGWGDPVIGVARTYLTSNIRKGVIWSNTQQYSNPKVDELLTLAGQEMDLEKRTKLYQEFQHIVVNEAPIRFISLVPFYSLSREELKNRPETMWGTHSPWLDTYIEQ